MYNCRVTVFFERNQVHFFSFRQFDESVRVLDCPEPVSLL